MFNYIYYFIISYQNVILYFYRSVHILNVQFWPWGWLFTYVCEIFQKPSFLLEQFLCIFFTLTILPRISLIYFLKILGMSWHICFCCLSFYSFENSQIYNNIYLPPPKKNNHNPLTSVQNIKYYAKSFNMLPISLKF